MHGRNALAALLAAAALGGCGHAAVPEPVSIDIVSPPPPAAARAAQPPAGDVRTGTSRSAPLVRPQAGPAAVAVAAQPKRRPSPASYRGFRRAQLAALRGHCRTRPKRDPRCDGARVDERVALAPFEAER